MDWKFNSPNIRTVNYKNIGSLQLTQDTFKAFVDAIIPRTPRLAEQYGEIQLFGALDFYTDEYLILTLNNYFIPIANPISELLDIVAEQFLSMKENKITLNLLRFQGGGNFAALQADDRLKALIFIEQLTFSLAGLPIMIQNNPVYVLSVISDLNRYTMMGYYSEWYGYGSTRLEKSNNRVLEFYPLSWNQIGYPGPSLGYRALRV